MEVKFMHSIDDQNLFEEAYIACAKIFKIAAKKVGKDLLSRTDETKSFQNIEAGLYQLVANKMH